eukprot:TRINITY_DN14148_c0_g7_i1.p1 TRINITY_DN14148_c0_g7~~TRINITY_DN14148_c0_g7_i1.p1  ORF type:complete len:185 (-),score=41.55 TRINITY_DN14148_c0_g7_i1:123-677(-)
MKISELSYEFYSRITGQAFLERLISIILLVINVLFIVASVFALIFRPVKPIPVILSYGLIAILCINGISVLGLIIQLFVKQRSLLSELLINESDSKLNKLWRILLIFFILIALIWFVVIQTAFFSSRNFTYIYWRSLYFIELLWISKVYALIMLSAAYVSYLVVELRLKKKFEMEELEEDDYLL